MRGEMKRIDLQFKILVIKCLIHILRILIVGRMPDDEADMLRTTDFSNRLLDAIEKEMR